MYICIYVFVSVSIYLSIYLSIYVFVYVYVYIYICIYRRRLRRVIAAALKQSPKHLWVLCELFHLPKARQVEVKARIITMTFAVNSAC